MICDDEMKNWSTISYRLVYLQCSSHIYLELIGEQHFLFQVHVAEYFIRNKSRSYDELYSQSYEEVGVLFASMPNFSDFYSEDAVNNQGLECLRFLNEVISDFDAVSNFLNLFPLFV